MGVHMSKKSTGSRYPEEFLLQLILPMASTNASFVRASPNYNAGATSQGAINPQLQLDRRSGYGPASSAQGRSSTYLLIT